MDPLNALQIALAVFGGYKGFQTSKKAHAGILGQILGTAGGAYGGYSLGTGISSLGEEAAPSIFGKEGLIGPAGSFEGTLGKLGIGSFTNPTAVDPYATAITPKAPLPESTLNNVQNAGGITTATTGYPVPQYATPPSTYEGVPKYWDQALPEGVTPSTSISNSGIRTLTPSATGSVTTDIAGNPRYTSGMNVENMGIDTGKAVQPLTGTPTDNRSFTDKFLYKQVWNPAKQQYESGDVNTMNLLLGGGAGALGYGYFSGAFDPVPKNSYFYGSNTLVPTLEKNREFYVKNPKTGEVTPIEKPFTTEQYNINNPPPNTQNFGPYQVTKFQSFNNGGLASLSHFREGGINYLPSKTINDEDNEDNYVRANGYVADATGAGNKDVDTMLAQLADGEFVTRTDGVLGAGILAGANPDDEKQMRKMGADFFYEQQRRFKRIFDLLDASRKATAH